MSKKKAYEALKALKADATLGSLYEHPFQDFSEDDPKFAVIQRLVILFYSRTAHMTSIDEARHHLYFSKNQSLDTIPPTKDALMLHVKRVIYQCGKWKQSLQADLQLPSPSAFGWQQSIMTTPCGSPNGSTCKRHQKRHANFISVRASQNVRDVNARQHL